MKTVETIGLATSAGCFYTQTPTDLAPGNYRVVIVVEETPAPESERAPLIMPVHISDHPKSEGSLASSQNARSFSTRNSGELPAMMALLMAPIEIPASQVGSIPAACRAS